jgi:predicted anti-sigma-YlaC factor YlaD
MLFRRCPSRKVLSEFATRPQSARIVRHVAECQACRKVLAELCENEELLAELRRATQNGVDERTRARIAAICERALKAEGTTP